MRTAIVLQEPAELLQILFYLSAHETRALKTVYVDSCRLVSRCLLMTARSILQCPLSMVVYSHIKCHSQYQRVCHSCRSGYAALKILKVSAAVTWSERLFQIRWSTTQNAYRESGFYEF